MNPQSRKNPLDGAKFREQYLSNLRLQASNDQKNQNANLIFKNTGQTPTQPPDMRTTTERASDIEALKVDLRSKLGTITSGVIASQIIGELEPDQIRFAIDNWGQIEPDMRRQFATGVPTSAFIAYLNRLIQKFQLTDGVETGLQQSSGDAIIMSNTQILYGLPRGQIWVVLKSLLDRVERQFGIPTATLAERVVENQALIPSQEELRIIAGLPPQVQADINRIGNDIYRNLPSNKDISDIIGEINIGMANRDRRYTEGALSRLAGIITLEPSVLDQMAEIRGIIADYFALNRGIEAEAEAEPSFAESAKSAGEDRPAPPPQPEASQAPRNLTQDEWRAFGTRQKAKKVSFLNARLTKNPDLVLTGQSGRRYGAGQGRRGTTRLFSSDSSTNGELNVAFEDYLAQTNGGTTGEGIIIKGKMTGKGLAKPKVEKPYRQSIAHLVDKPMEKPKPYTQFGRYFINKHRLEGEGIVAFRQPSGNTIASLPTEKVSPRLAKVIKTLVGKGIPSYEDISALDKAEKEKLCKITKTCNVDNPAIPKMKGEGEQEEDRFNILRGEIIAGNDNAKIAKEFKVMLMKFVAEGRIPKRQANEILHELLALGH
jgi:FtsZ-interacting cell division protein YlmF